MRLIMRVKKSKFNRITYSYTSINQVLRFTITGKQIHSYRCPTVTRWSSVEIISVIKSAWSMVLGFVESQICALCPTEHYTKVSVCTIYCIDGFYRFLKKKKTHPSIDKGQETYFSVTLYIIKLF